MSRRYLLKKATAVPAGTTLDKVTGEIMVTLSAPVSNHVFTGRAFNDTGECSAKVVLSAKHRLPLGSQICCLGIRLSDTE